MQSAIEKSFEELRSDITFRTIDLQLQLHAMKFQILELFRKCLPQTRSDKPLPKKEELNFSEELSEKHVAYLIDFLIDDNYADQLSLDKCSINASSAPHLARLLQSNSRLIEVSLESNHLGDDGIRSLAEALPYNTRLRRLNLTNNEIGINGIKYLARALVSNRHLTHVHLEQNPISSVGIEYLSIALKANYALVELTLDEKDELITLYLQRNQRLEQGLAPLNDALRQGLILEESEQILKCLNQISIVFPNLSELPDDSYPQEAYRLLTALGHRTVGDAEAAVAAVHALLPSFTNQSFQSLAHQVLGLLFSSDVLKPKLQEMGLLNDCLLFSLYALEPSSSSPDIETFAYMALYRYFHEAQVYTIKEKYAFEACNVLLTEKELSHLLHIARQASTKGNPEEALLLRDALKRTKIAPPLADICQVPAFRDALKSKYPQAQKITTPAYCLWAAASRAPLLVSIPEPSDVPFVAKALEPRPTVEDLITPIKKRLADIVPQGLTIPEPRLDENTTKIETMLSLLGDDYDDFKAIELRDQRLDALAQFRELYEYRLSQDRARCFGFFRRSRLNPTQATSLNNIVDHALKHRGYRTRSVMKALGWLKANGQVEKSIRALIAYERQEPSKTNSSP